MAWKTVYYFVILHDGNTQKKLYRGTQKECIFFLQKNKNRYKILDVEPDMVQLEFDFMKEL